MDKKTRIAAVSISLTVFGALIVNHSDQIHLKKKVEFEFKHLEILHYSTNSGLDSFLSMASVALSQSPEQL